ncbi:hypothetical protein [Polluticoccus soli]|uniref:hypothetical protein n=1 Tax=Polluticoccus soli TaxID=3034150 RepID=UPI0023E1584A|nr:hypothetical protein [Flavipsychrobacter sp. JY13-12]
MKSYEEYQHDSGKLHAALDRLQKTLSIDNHILNPDNDTKIGAVLSYLNPETVKLANDNNEMRFDVGRYNFVVHAIPSLMDASRLGKLTTYLAIPDDKTKDKMGLQLIPNLEFTVVPTGNFVLPDTKDNENMFVVYLSRLYKFVKKEEQAIFQ